jgi:hypothetical protein
LRLAPAIKAIAAWLRRGFDGLGSALSGGRDRAVAGKPDDDDTVFQERPAHERAELAALKALRESYDSAADPAPTPLAETKRNAGNRDTPGKSA